MNTLKTSTTLLCNSNFLTERQRSIVVYRDWACGKPNSSKKNYMTSLLLLHPPNYLEVKFSSCATCTGAECFVLSLDRTGGQVLAALTAREDGTSIRCQRRHQEPLSFQRSSTHTVSKNSA